MYRFILISFISIIFSLSINYTFSQDEHEGRTIKGEFKMIRIRSYDAALDTQKIEESEVMFETVNHCSRSGAIEKSLKVDKGDTLGYTYHRDNDDKLLNTLVYRGAALYKKIEFGYNSMGELVSQTYTDPTKDFVISKERYNYDDSGLLIESVITDDHGAITARMKYDDAENIVEFNLSSGKVELKYDTLGREIEEIVYNNEGMLLSKSFSVYENGLLKEWYEEDHEGVVEWRTTYTYSNFDKEGNWLRKVIYEDGEVDGVVIREIEYY